jgi:DNA-directed DNA polymerase III PolC
MPVALHTHSWYSLLEGVSSPEQLLDRAAACGHRALALTDTNNLYGAVPFVELARRRGIRPLLGACLRQGRSHCVALIAERAGYSSLCRILSRLHLGEPRELGVLLAENAPGLHVLVDEPGLAERLRAAFGLRLWLEVVRPPRSWQREGELLAAARRLGMRLVASTAAHYATAAEYPAFRLLTAVRQGGLLDQLPDRLPLTPAHHLITAQELARRFRDLPEAVRNTDLLAEQMRSDVLPHETVLPRPRLPHDLEAGEYLRRLCERGLRRRDLGQSLEARRRLQEELTVIEAGELAGYFLVVRDIARYARRRRYSMALRGSAGNSLVCYLLEITDVDPLRFGLSLERFLHAGRPDLPDIDLDFDWKVRDQVIAHVLRRHPRHAAMISSHLFLQPRSAFREAAKAHGLSNEQVSRLLEELPERVERILLPPASRGRQPPEDVLTPPGADASGSPAVPDVAAAECPPGFPLEPERWPRLLHDAGLLLGRPHHLSIHPGGVVITPRPLENYVPLQLAPKGVVITQFEKDAAEYVGLVKIDLLGNRALATVDEARRLVAASGGPALSPTEVSAIADPNTLELLRRGDTLGVTQLESPAMRHLLMQIQPDGVEEVIQSLALVRPGTALEGMKGLFLRRRRGLEAIGELDPRLEMLRPTQGLMLYDDDGLRVLQALTGMDVIEAYRFFKRVKALKDGEESGPLASEFLRLCALRGVPEAVAGPQWVQLAKYRRYSFCKSHAVSYGLLAWLSAYLKTHHPLPFWTAVLNNNQGSYPRRVYVEAVKRAGIPLRLPCVNRSAAAFAVEGDAIRVGLDAIATVPAELKAAALAERQARGPYRDLADFRRRVRPGPEALAALIRCGALDVMGLPRPALFLEADLQDAAGSPDTPSLFPVPCVLSAASWSPADYDAERRLHDEWELLGFLLGPPLMSLFRPLLPSGLITSPEVAANLGRTVSIAGVVATGRQARTADGRDMQFVTLEDEGGLVDVTLFPGACPLLVSLGLGPYLAIGRIDDHLGVLTVTARRLVLWEGAR